MPRPGYIEPAKEWSLIALVILVGCLQFGGAFLPSLGMAWIYIQAGVLAIIAAAGILTVLFRR